MSRVRSAIAIITAFLFLGSAGTVTVAWACVRYGELRSWHADDPAGSWAWPVPIDWPQAMQFGSSEEFGLTWTVSGASAAPWLSETEPCKSASGLRAGWPYRALYWYRIEECVNLTPVWYDTHGVIPGSAAWKPLSRWGLWCGLVRRDLPALPLWGDFVLDTALFGAAGAALLLGPRVCFVQVRARRRKKQGQCSACGYHMAGLAACPECGGTARSGADSKDVGVPT